MAEQTKKSFLEKAAESQVWKSIFRGGGVPRNRRQRMMSVLNSVFLHLHTVRLPEHAVKLKFTWCMGGLSFFIFLILTISGILLMFYYRPTIEYAYTDIIDLAEQVPFGIMRELHRWGAHAMVITVCRCYSVIVNPIVKFYRLSFTLGSTSDMGDHCWWKHG